MRNFVRQYSSTIYKKQEHFTTNIAYEAKIRTMNKLILNLVMV